MQDSFIINDITRLAHSIRKNAAITRESYDEDLDKFITINQVESLIRDNMTIDENDTMVINEDQYDSIFTQVRYWIYNTGLAKLAADNKIECAWDDETNSMIFWSNEIDNVE